MKQEYQSINFREASLRMIERVDGIVKEYVGQGYRLTVRQLYYQLVARGIIENTERSYQNTCSLVNDARMAGLIDWEAIEDRTRSFIRETRWTGGASILRACVSSYHEDMWANQKKRAFVIVEKEALAGVLERVCSKYDVPLLAARGYPSGTVLREFALSDLQPCFIDKDGEAKPKEEKQIPIILHLGDHDPSGIDMTRDLSERLRTFCAGVYREGEDMGGMFQRIALNMPQVREKNPPENPAKTTDSRFKDYRRSFGESSWELDALEPEYLSKLVERNINSIIDKTAWRESKERIAAVKAKLEGMAAQFEENES